MATTLAGLTTTIFGAAGDQGLVQDGSFYSSATTRINAAVTAVAGGIRMPNGQVSPPLPDLYKMATVTSSITLPYVSLPTDYMRGVFLVADSSGHQIYPPKGGDYYSFGLFLRQAPNKGLSQAGAISSVVCSGTKLYYRAIPSAANTLTVHYHKTPTAMTITTSEPDGLPAHLAERIIVSYVAKEIFSMVEDGGDNLATGYKIHSSRFFEAMIDLIDFIGDVDASPSYYGEGSYQDLGIVD